jgi:LacI family transcriptional regulator, galactose operon repressor
MMEGTRTADNARDYHERYVSRRPPTISDVAELANVSPTTVSHVLTGNRKVGPATLLRVQAAMEELNYRPSGLAQSLRLRRSHTVALLVPDISNPFYPALARGLQDALIESGYHALLCNTDAKHETERAFLEVAISRRIDGVVIASFHPSVADVFMVHDAGIPVVVISSEQPPRCADWVSLGDEEASAAAVRYLIDVGHSRIGHIAGPFDLEPPGKRLLGYRHALEEAGLGVDEQLVVTGADYTVEGGRQGMSVLIERRPRPTAVFCDNDLMAIGALQCASSLGLAVPTDIAVMGYDDIAAASYVSPTLTTVMSPVYEQGHRSGELLLERMTGSYEGPGRSIQLHGSVVKRASA